MEKFLPDCYSLNWVTGKGLVGENYWHLGARNEEKRVQIG